MKTDLDATLERVLDVSQVDNLAEEPKIEAKSVASSVGRGDEFFLC